MFRYIIHLLLPFAAFGILFVGACVCQESETPSTVVTTELDIINQTDGLVSLREAITYAGEGGTITFAETIPGGTVIKLEKGCLEITKPLGIDASSVGGLTIDGCGKDRVFLFNITSGGAGAGLIGVTVTGGNKPGASGGGISVNQGELTLTDVTVTGNRAGDGGGIHFNRGVLRIIDSVIAGDTAERCGGGICSDSGALLLTVSAAVSDRLGEIDRPRRSVSITGTKIAGNTAQEGGGIYVSTGDMIMAESTVSENSAETGGGINNAQLMTVTGSTIARNVAAESGGGIYNSGILSAADVTIDGNSANRRGGGFCNIFELSLTQTAVSGNFAITGGGGYNEKKLKMRQTTLTGNSADSGGGLADSGGTVSVAGSTVSDNTAKGGGGGICNINGELTVGKTAIVGNSACVGGGIENIGGLFRITGSKISGNSADRLGGAFLNIGGSRLENLAIVGNTSKGRGGGICNLRDSDSIRTFLRTGNPVENEDWEFDGKKRLSLVNVTVVGNSAKGGGGIDTFVNLALNNSIVALNRAEDGSGDLGGTFADRISGMNNMIGGEPGFAAAPVFEEGKLANADALDLSLLEGSAAIDAGSNDAAEAETDLAGNPRIAGAAVDLGAYEYQGNPDAAEPAEEPAEQPAAQ